VKILVLSPYPESIAPAFTKADDEFVAVDREIDAAFIHANRADRLVIYGYRHILNEEMLNLVPQRAINLHISYLPWNRGADPNFWSFFDKTPKGVSIHHIDRGIDTGEILAQREVTFDGNETLASSHVCLKKEIEKLFVDTWVDIRSGHLKGKPQPRAGSYHNAKDKEPVFSTLPDGWETPVNVIENLGEEYRRASGFVKENIS
jgi:methionyl-tRNA formyltransferase